MKKGRLILAIIFIIGSFCLLSFSETNTDICVYINKTIAKDNACLEIEGYAFESTLPILKQEDTTMFPIRAFAENFGYHLIWSEAESKISLNKLDNTESEIIFVINSNQMIVDGQVYTMPQKCVLINDSAYVPLRFLCENLGYSVAWYAGAEEKESIWIYTGNFLLFDDVLAEPAISVEEIKTNYSVVDAPANSMLDLGSYELNANGKTNRNVGIGSSLEHVISQYGQPFEISGENDLVFTYFSLFIPDTSYIGIMNIYIQDNIVNKIEICPPRN